MKAGERDTWRGQRGLRKESLAGKQLIACTREENRCSTLKTEEKGGWVEESARLGRESE